MAKWYYYNENDEKVGPVRGRELKQLAQQGTVTPETKVEDSEGRIAHAKNVTGLTFPSVIPLPSNSAENLEEQDFEQLRADFERQRELESAIQKIVPPLAPPAPPPPAPPAGANPFAAVPPGTSFAAAPPPAQPAQPAPPPFAHLFCTNCGHPIAEQAVACMACGAKPTGHKKFCRYCGTALNPEQVICTKCGVAITGSFSAGGAAIANLMPTFQTPGISLDATQHKTRIQLSTVLCILSFMLATTASLVLSCLDLAGNSLEAAEHMDVTVEDLIEFGLTAIVLLFYLAYLVCYFFYLLRLWETIPEEFARTTPVKAALLMLIPFFNWYWQFVAFWGLYKDMNRTTESYGHGSRFNDSLILIMCIGWIVINVTIGMGSVIVGVAYGIYYGPLQPSDTGFRLIAIITLIGIDILYIIVTSLVYWIISKDVREFFDIQSSMGKQSAQERWDVR